MNNEKARWEKLQKQSEKAFTKICEGNGLAYMYIDQNQDTFSSDIWSAKRPDFLVSIPNMGSIFVDVKAREEHRFWKDAFEQLDEIPPSAFNFGVEEVQRYALLEEITSLKVWYAVMKVHKDTLTKDILMIPNERVHSFLTKRHIEWTSWKYVRAPKSCFIEDIAELAFNICSDCERSYCEEIDKLIEIEDKIHGTFQKDKVKNVA